MNSSPILRLQINNNINSHLSVHSAQCSEANNAKLSQSRNHCSLGVTETRTPQSLRAASQPNTGATSTTRPLWSHCLTTCLRYRWYDRVCFQKASSLELNLLSWYLFRVNTLRRSTGTLAVRKMSGSRLTRSAKRTRLRMGI